MERSTLVITGTSRGLGKGLAEYYLGRGFSVVGISRSSSSIACKEYHHYKANLADVNDLERVVREIKDHHKKVYALINNAGIASLNHLLLTPLETVVELFNVNTIAPFYLMREFSKLMLLEGEGRIINILSPATRIQLEGEGAYSSSKAGLESFTKSFSRELSCRGVTVNAVAPTLYDSKLISKVPKEKLDSIRDKMHIRRDTQLDDVTNVCDFFLSEKSHYITGQMLSLGGLG